MRTESELWTHIKAIDVWLTFYKWNSEWMKKVDKLHL